MRFAVAGVFSVLACALLMCWLYVLVDQYRRRLHWFTSPFVWACGVALARLGLDAYVRIGLLAVMPVPACLACASTGVAVGGMALVRMSGQLFRGTPLRLGLGQPPLLLTFLGTSLFAWPSLPSPQLNSMFVMALYFALYLIGGLAPVLFLCGFAARGMRQMRTHQRAGAPPAH